MTGQGIVFKNNKTGKLDNIPGNDITSIHWQRIASTQGLRVITKNGSFFRFGGFSENDYDRVASFFRDNFNLNVKEKEFSLKGWNWGVANFSGPSLNFDVDKHTAFELPLHNVSACTSAKNEVTLEFHPNDEAPVSLMELRFHVPNGPEQTAEEASQIFKDMVLSKADIIQATGESIVTFPELHCLTPRGRYDVKLFPTFIQLHGKTFDYKIPLTTVLRLFQLPHKDQRQVYFVLSLDPPIKQGQTRYHFVILNFNKEDEVELDLNIGDDMKEKFDAAKINSHLEGPTIHSIGKVMKVLVQRKITTPSENFCGKFQVPVITCSYKSSVGYLYPLERGFIYVHKPPIHLRFEEIANINFARSGGSTRSFDFEIETKSGILHVFSSIEKEEYTKLFDFVTSKKLRVKNTGAPSAKETVDDDLMDSDADDEPDAYMARVKQEGRERELGSDEESDESFNPDKAGSGSNDSDVAEEFDSDAESSEGEDGDDGDEDSDGARKKKKHKKEKKPKEKKHKSKKSKESGSSGTSKVKKAKDPDKPKKPMTAFFIWLNENRDKIKEDNPSLSFTEIAKKGGEMWKDVKDKSKYEKEHEKLKKVYDEKMKDYVPPPEDSLPPTKSSKKSSSKKSSSTSSSKKSSSPKKSAAGGFISKEFIEDDDSSEDSDAGGHKKKKSKSSSKDEKKSSSSKDKKKKSRKTSGDEEEMKSLGSGDEESAASTPASDDDSD